ncbi:hypothetical protein ACTXT3_17440 [Klebsiella pneumoniae]|uniref:hypothetical protein n=1 Tax=Klebsiella pneumoniae TaxID=573 RepID=UPI003FD4C221
MYHLDNTSGVPEMPEPKEQQSISPRWFGESEEQGGISWPGADWFNIIQAEMLAIMDKAGMEPDKLKFNQIAQSIDVLSELIVREKVGPSAKADFLGYLAEKQRASQRIVRSKLNDIPSILDYRTDSQNDDSLRIRLAIEDGCDNLFIPGRQEFRPLYIGEINIPTTIRFWGNGSQSINADGSVMVKLSDAAYGFHFNGQEMDKRPMGGGFHNIHLRGAADDDEGALVKVTTWSYFKAVNCAFNNLSGYAAILKDCMESSIRDSVFRRIGTDATGVILLDDYLGHETSNVNNLHISGNTFGFNSGGWIKASDKANADLIWIGFNKFEYDDTPASPNTSSQSVIDLGKVSRVWLHANGFTHFRATKNNYRNCILLRETALFTTRITENEFYACENAWDVRGGTVFARSNRSNSVDYAAITTSVTSTEPQDIEPITNHSSNGNVTGKGPLFAGNFVSAHKIPGVVKSPFMPDSGASESTVLSVGAGLEIRRLRLARHFLDDVSVVKVYARVKSSAAGGVVKLNIDNTIDKPSLSVPSDRWTLVRWQLRPTETLSGQLKFINTGATTILFDGLFVEKASSLQWEFAWSPGQIPAHSSVASPLQGYQDTVGNPGLIKGFSMPVFDTSLQGVKITVSPTNSSGSFTVTLFNDTDAPIAVSISRVFITLFLV